MSVIDDIDGLNHYGVSVVVKDGSVEDGELYLETFKDNSTRHDNKVRLYRENGEWGCTMYDNYAVIDKALGMLNE